MKLYIFSDVVCPWSWGEEKVLRSIDYIYGGKIEFENIMGGMITDYHDILPMNMKDKGSDEIANKILKQMWIAGNSIHEMPIMDEIPNLLSRENPSTNKLDKYVVVAKKIDREKSNIFLRLLREATILDNINTLNMENIIPLLEKSIIDIDEFNEIYASEADELFLEDRMSTFDRRLESFPNFMYVNEKNKEFILKGYKTKKELINFIEQYSNLKPVEIEKNEHNFMDFITKYKRVFKVELLDLFEDEEYIQDMLTKFSDELVIDNEEIKSKS